LTQAAPYDNAKAVAEVAVWSFGDFQNFHLYLHILAIKEVTPIIDLICPKGGSAVCFLLL
jgi:hypothetical protein